MVQNPFEFIARRRFLKWTLGVGGFVLGGGGADAFDAFLADEPPNIVSDLKNALTWIELGPVLYDTRWQTFSGLGQTEREAHFTSWMESDELLRRKVAVAFRKFVNLVLYDDPSIWPRIAYPGPSMGART